LKHLANSDFSVFGSPLFSNETTPMQTAKRDIQTHRAKRAAQRYSCPCPASQTDIVRKCIDQARPASQPGRKIMAKRTSSRQVRYPGEGSLSTYACLFRRRKSWEKNEDPRKGKARTTPASLFSRREGRGTDPGKSERKSNPARGKRDRENPAYMTRSPKAKPTHGTVNKARRRDRRHV